MITEMLRLLVAHKSDRYTFLPYSAGKVNFSTIPQELGLYIHIPFCRTICPFCPYNKKKYNTEIASKYFQALQKEFKFYLPYLKNKLIQSIYIGGGTPTLMIKEIRELLERIKEEINFSGEVGIEVHPNEATAQNFEEIKKAKINLVSLGIQSFSDDSLDFLQRGYDSTKSHDALRMAMDAGFDCVDVDLMYNIPGQKPDDIIKDIQTCLSYDVDQISAYPLIVFPMTPLQDKIQSTGRKRLSELSEYKIQRAFNRITSTKGYVRTSIWTYGKSIGKRYTSVTRETFLGLGSSAASLYNDHFYVNTFDVQEYVNRIESGYIPISLVNHMSEREKQVFWLFWRCYDTNLNSLRFAQLFGNSIKERFPLLSLGLKILGLATEHNDCIQLTSLGAFCFHLIEKQYSLRYLNKLWDESMKNAWPCKLEL